MDSNQLARVLILGDSRTRSASLLTWVAMEHKSQSRRILVNNIDVAGSYDMHYVDVNAGGTPCRLVGAEPDMLAEPVMSALVRSTRLVMLLAKSAKAGKALADLVNKAPGLFREKPQLVCICSEKPTPAESSVFTAEGIPLHQVGDAMNFGSIWRHIRDAIVSASPKPPQNPSSGPKKPLSGNTPADRPVTAAQTPTPTTKGINMANAADSLTTLMTIDGALGGLIADYASGMVLAKTGGGVNLDVAAAGNSEVIKSKMKTMNALGLKENIEDILITLGTQYHIIRPVLGKAGIFIYLVLDKAKANLAMARFKVQDVEKSLAL